MIRSKILKKHKGTELSWLLLKLLGSFFLNCCPQALLKVSGKRSFYKDFSNRYLRGSFDLIKQLLIILEVISLTFCLFLIVTESADIVVFILLKKVQNVLDEVGIFLDNICKELA